MKGGGRGRQDGTYYYRRMYKHTLATRYNRGERASGGRHATQKRKMSIAGEDVNLGEEIGAVVLRARGQMASRVDVLMESRSISSIGGGRHASQFNVM